jgi:hypothetical protein
MNEKSEISTKVVALQKTTDHHALITTNRWLLIAVFSLMTLIVIAGFIFLPTNNVTSSKKTVSAEPYVNEKNPVLSSEVNVLKGQFVGLLSGSIESKLRILEENVRLGAISQSLGAIEDIKNDVKVLRTYSEPSKEMKALANEQIIEEMTQLKRLVYLTIASCGLMIVAIAGIWFKQYKQLNYKEMLTRYLGKH